MAVFNRGIWKGLKGLTPWGGQRDPNSMAGDKLLWKKAQKKDKKKSTSDVINKIMPHRSPTPTFQVCNPWYVPSRLTSRHHWYIIRLVEITPRIIRFILNVWNHFASPDTSVITLKALKIGQGLLSTRWKGWFMWCVDIRNFSRVKRS